MHSLKKLNTFGIDIQAEMLDFVYSEEAISEIIKKFEGPFKVLGGGSNILFTSSPQEHILVNRIKGKYIIDEDKEHVFVKAGGGEDWHDFVLWSIDKGFGGIENLSLIPGTVGAAPIQNIGAYGVEQESVFHRLNAIDLQTGKKLSFDHKSCQFGYRDSVFKNHLKGKFFISSVVYRLDKKPTLNLTYGSILDEIFERQIENPSIKDVSNIVIDIRKSKLPDPKEIGNSGSFFKNPIIPKEQYAVLLNKFDNIPSYPYSDDAVKIPAGWLIDKGGWKGIRQGNVGTHKMQALVIVNYGNATGQEIWSFAQTIIEKVYTKYGIRLEPEVNIW